MKQLKINPSITDRSEESLNKYLLEISHIPMVNTDEEVILAQAIHAGGKNGERPRTSLSLPTSVLLFLSPNSIKTKECPLPT